MKMKDMANRETTTADLVVIYNVLCAQNKKKRNMGGTLYARTLQVWSPDP